MKLKTTLSRILIVVIALGVIFAIWHRIQPKFNNTSEELDYLLNDTVKRNKPIQNAMLYVMKGDGSFTWSGAAGMASQSSQVPMTINTPTYLASVTKLYVATVVMRLYELGMLRLDDPMAKYLSDDLIHGLNDYQGHDYSDEITIEQLLAHTSGIPDYYDEKGNDGLTLFEIFKANQQRQWNVEDQIARARDDMTPKFKPGEKASYSDTNYQLLGMIIEKVTGKPLQEVFVEFIFQPLGLKHTWLVGVTHPQEESMAAIADVFSGDEDITQMRSSPFYWADGGLISTPEDEVLFLKALNEGRIIKKDTLELMHHWQPIKNTGPFQYGYGTMEVALPSAVSWAVDVLPVWGHTGSVGSFLYYSPSQDIYVAGTINQTEDNMTALMLMIKAILAVP